LLQVSGVCFYLTRRRAVLEMPCMPRRETFRETFRPGRRGACAPRLPQIRTCPIEAYGSSADGLAMRQSNLLTEARRTPPSLSSRVTGTGDGATVDSACFPPLGPSACSTLPFTGSLEASSPASTVLWRCATPWVPGAALRFLRLALPDAVPVVSLPTVQVTRPRARGS
jgi:hypothetical protein